MQYSIGSKIASSKIASQVAFWSWFLFSGLRVGLHTCKVHAKKIGMSLMTAASNAVAKIEEVAEATDETQEAANPKTSNDETMPVISFVMKDDDMAVMHSTCPMPIVFRLIDESDLKQSSVVLSPKIPIEITREEFETMKDGIQKTEIPAVLKVVENEK